MRPRATELGRYIAKQRYERGWSMYDLATKADVSYRTMYKAEVHLRARLRHGTLEKIAGKLDVHPNELFIRAGLTPYLSSPAAPPPVEGPVTKERVFEVTDDEYEKLNHYLGFLRYSSLVPTTEQTPPQ